MRSGSALVLPLLVILACGACAAPGDESVSGAKADTKSAPAEPDVSSPELTLTVERSGDTAGPRLAFEAEVVGPKEVLVKVLVRDVNSLYALATHLTWDASQLELTDSSGHLMLMGSGYDTRVIAKPFGKDRFLLGAARFRMGGSPWGGIDGVDVGKQLWATLSFKVVGDGPTELSFDADHTTLKSNKYEDLTASLQKLSIRFEGRTP